jgi:hypothetical protein
MFSDSTGRIHIVFAANQWEDNFGNKRQGNALMETIRQPDGWTEPAFITQLTPGGQQEVVQLANGDVELAWIDILEGDPVFLISTQPAYHCDDELLPAAMRVILNVVQSGNYHPVDYQPPFCGNRFDEFVYLPSPEPEFAVLPEGEVDGFDQIADLINSR